MSVHRPINSLQIPSIRQQVINELRAKVANSNILHETFINKLFHSLNHGYKKENHKNIIKLIILRIINTNYFKSENKKNKNWNRIFIVWRWSYYSNSYVVPLFFFIFVLSLNLYCSQKTHTIWRELFN